jgi:hypothetical protein
MCRLLFVSALAGAIVGTTTSAVAHMVSVESRIAILLMCFSALPRNQPKMQPALTFPVCLLNLNLGTGGTRQGRGAHERSDMWDRQKRAPDVADANPGYAAPRDATIVAND